METIRLPELDCPFPSEVSLHADAVSKGSAEWVKRFGLVDDDSGFHKVGIAQLAGRYHPRARKEVLQLVSDLCAWMFIRDDRLDESEIGICPEDVAAWDGRFIDILEGREPTEQDEPLAFAMRDLRERLRAHSPSKLWMRRFIRSVREHFEAQLWESINRLRGDIPDIETYVRVRRRTGGLYVDSDLIEITDEVALPPDVLHHPTVKLLREASMNVVVWSNDLLSLEKEIRSGETTHNLVFVVRHAFGLSLQEAVVRVAEMHDAEVRLFLELTEDIPRFGMELDLEIERYVRALRARMRGNLDWTLKSARYRAAARETIMASAAGLAI